MNFEDTYTNTTQTVEEAFADTITCRPALQKEDRAVARQDRMGEVYLSGEWKFFVTLGKLMGLAPSNARRDDLINVLMGASVPFILPTCLKIFGCGVRARGTLLSPWIHVRGSLCRHGARSEARRGRPHRLIHSSRFVIKGSSYLPLRRSF